MDRVDDSSVDGEDGLTSRPRRCRFLVILFGTLEYDGRAERMIEVLSGLGRVTLVDSRKHGAIPGTVTKGIDRITVELPVGAGKAARHLRLWRTALRVCRRIKPQVVVAENVFTTMPGWLLARLSRAGLIYDAYELIIPESGTRMSPRDRIWYSLEHWVAPRADLVVAANQERAALMAEHYHLSRTPDVMRNIPVQPGNGERERELLTGYPALTKRNAQERIVLYQGYMTLSRGIGRFCEAMAYLPAHFRLILVGGGPDEQRIATVVHRFGLSERIIQLGLIPHRGLPALTRACDVGIVTYPFSGLNNIYCSPNKVFEYAQAGLPMIATNQPPLRAMVERYQIGRCVGPEDSPAAIAEAIHEIAGRPKANYEAALKLFLDDHRREDEAERLRSSIRRLLLSRNVA